MPEASRNKRPAMVPEVLRGWTGPISDEITRKLNHAMELRTQIIWLTDELKEVNSRQAQAWMAFLDGVSEEVQEQAE